MLKRCGQLMNGPVICFINPVTLSLGTPLAAYAAAGTLFNEDAPTAAMKKKLQPYARW